MRRACSLAAVAIAFAGCTAGSAVTPTSFGVNVTVDAAQLDAATRSGIFRAALTVSGDEAFTKTFDIHKPIQNGRVRFRYIPLTHTGTLLLEVDALDTTGTAVATGSSAPVLLVDNHAVEALVTLSVGAPLDLGVASDGEASPDSAVLQPNGIACTQPSDCESGFCVDGFCCASDCSDACHTCGLAGALGICNLAPSGSDPHNNCGDDGTPCGLDGTCDGTGGCRFRTVDTICRPQSCDVPSGMLSHATACDGKGSCPAATVEGCAPYVCEPDGSGCFSDCVADGGSTACLPPKTCTAGSCGPKPNGRVCAADSECQSGKCRDGFCCNVDCNTTCFACNVPGKAGTCSPAPAGSAAGTGSCTNPTNNPCGATGTCDGTGKCTFPSGNLCSNGSCAATSPPTAHKASTCDGTGLCKAASPAAVSCKNYACYTSTSGSFVDANCYTNCGSCLGLCCKICGSCAPFQTHCSSGTCTAHCVTSGMITGGAYTCD